MIITNTITTTNGIVITILRINCRQHNFPYSYTYWTVDSRLTLKISIGDLLSLPSNHQPVMQNVCWIVNTMTARYCWIIIWQLWYKYYSIYNINQFHNFGHCMPPGIWFSVCGVCNSAYLLLIYAEVYLEAYSKRKLEASHLLKLYLDNSHQADWKCNLKCNRQFTGV